MLWTGREIILGTKGEGHGPTTSPAKEDELEVVSYPANAMVMRSSCNRILIPSSTPSWPLY